MIRIHIVQRTATAGLANQADYADPHPHPRSDPHPHPRSSHFAETNTGMRAIIALSRDSHGKLATEYDFPRGDGEEWFLLSTASVQPGLHLDRIFALGYQLDTVLSVTCMLKSLHQRKASVTKCKGGRIRGLQDAPRDNR